MDVLMTDQKLQKRETRELEDKARETIQSEAYREKRLNKKNRNLAIQLVSINGPKVCD